jgi:hypothetical protein
MLSAPVRRIAWAANWVDRKLVYQLACFHEGRLLRRDPRVRWLGEPEGLETNWFAWASLRTPAPKRRMDAYFCAFGRSAGADLVTFDRRYLQFEGDALKITLLA